MESDYFTDEFVKNRFEQLDVLKQLAVEIEDNVLLMASIANEPLDWVCSFNEYLETGDIRPLIAGLIPFIPNVSKVKGVWLGFREAVDLDANDILKFYKRSGVGTGAHSGMHGVPNNRAATELEQLSKTPGLVR